MTINRKAFNVLGLSEERKECLDLLQAQCLATHNSQALEAVKGPVELPNPPVWFNE